MQHLDEGMIHAWLDGQLPRDEAAAVEAHVAECRQCADAVAEARGLIAASSRILTALDSVPRDVAPKPVAASESALPEGVLSLRREAPPNVEATPVETPVTPIATRKPRRWFTAPTLAAAAAAVVAVGMFSLYQRDGVPTSASSLSQSAASAADSPVATPTSVAVPAASQPLAAGAAANEARPPAAPAPSPQIARQEADRPVETRKRAAFADSAVAMDGRRKVAEEKTTADASKPKELARAVPAVPMPSPDTSTVTVIRGAAVAAERLQVPALAKASADRADSLGRISGRVTDANNTAIVGAIVQVAGTNTAITTNAQGEYSLGGVKPGEQQLVVRSIGYQQAKRDIAVVQGQTVSADIVITPAPLNLEQVVVTGTAGGRERSDRARRSAPAPTPAAPASGAVADKNAVTQAQATAAGCYEWTVTSTTAQQRTRFLQVPRRLALDTVVTPSSNDGIWYLARDLSRTAVLPNGLWRPIESGIEVQWVVGAKTSTVRLTGQANSVMRGTIEEIDRSAGTGESGNVISMRRACEG